jgi:Uma2 family endonuclease
MSAASVPFKLILGPELAGTLMTPEEFDEVEEYDEEYRYELVHGVLVVAPIPLAEERDPNEELGSWLRVYRRQHPLGHAMDKTLAPEHVRTRTGRRLADRVIWAGLGRVPDIGQDLPAIVIEFVSAGRRNRDRDYVDKRQEYIEVGVQEYWIIDRFKRRLTVIRNASAGPEEIVVPEDDTYRTPLLPGFELPLAALLSLCDEWGR